jgi:(p)ppGpp synthase/HD superfamily hydrolase
MTMSSDLLILFNAIKIAMKAHSGQKDKAGMDYIHHPLRVMCSMKDLKTATIAILHDVIEEDPIAWGPSTLKNQGIPDDIIEAVLALTRNDGESYSNYIDRVSKNNLAIIVKLPDLEDNMNLSRIAPGQLNADDLKRNEQYREAYSFLVNYAKDVK